MKKTVLAAVAILLAACSPKTTVTSPDGRISVRFALDAEGVPCYAVDVDGKPFLEPSTLGLQAEGVNLQGTLYKIQHHSNTDKAGCKKQH